MKNDKKPAFDARRRREEEPGPAGKGAEAQRMMSNTAPLQRGGMPGRNTDEPVMPVNRNMSGAPAGMGAGTVPGAMTGMGGMPAGMGMEAEAGHVRLIGHEQLQEFRQILQKYKSGSNMTKMRIIASENWWKLRNSAEEQKKTNVGADGGFTSQSAWLHNVIVSKHADAMEGYPEPNIIPREESDKDEAKMLSAIIPCILDQNGFESVYSDAMWQKCKSGTGVYKIVWDKDKLNGLGDITIHKANILNLYWEPGVTDIQKSRFFFQVEMEDKDVLEERYPGIDLWGADVLNSKYAYDDTVTTENKVSVVEVYYRKKSGSKTVLHYCKFVGDNVLYATENELTAPTDDMGKPIGESMAKTGLYDHGKYPYVFDPLYPIEGSPCGYGYVDVCKNPQTEIDLMKTGFVKNAMVGAVPRYFSRQDGNVNEEEFLDLSRPIVHVNGSVDEASLRQINFNQLPGVYVNMLDRTIQELRETTGNTETSTGTASGVTAASAIAALQEASGKGSRDSTQASYRAFSSIVTMVIELVRQFYDTPRKFRILGEMGQESFVTYTNKGLREQSQGNAFGMDMGMRRPEFDIKVSAQKKNVYTKVSQNELALQFFKMGFFNPQMTDQAMMCLDMMDFDGKDAVMRKVSQMGGMMQLLQTALPLAMMAAMSTNPMLAQQLMVQAQKLGIPVGMPGMPGMPGAAPMGMMPGGNKDGNVSLPESDNISGIKKKEHGIVRNAREKALNSTQPSSGKTVKSEEERK